MIPQRDLRNNVGEILRAAEAGDRFTVTVRGRPVARVVPLEGSPGPRVDVPAEEVDEILGRHESEADWLWELRAAEEPV